MNRNAVCILANNMYFLGAIINNIPLNRSYDIIIINETRIGNKIPQIKDICKNIANIEIIDSEQIRNEFKKILNNSFVDAYTMGMNILPQWYLFKFTKYEKIIFIDDDVIVNDLEKIFQYNESLFYKFRLSAGAKTYDENSINQKILIKTFGDIFDVKICKENYSKVWLDNHINAGQRMYTRNDFNVLYYENSLKRFYENKNIKVFWNKRKKHSSYYLDEWFESFFAYKTGIINNKLAKLKLAYVEIRNVFKVDFSKYKQIKFPIWHNATCSHKHRWLQKFKDIGVIK